MNESIAGLHTAKPYVACFSRPVRSVLLLVLALATASARDLVAIGPQSRTVVDERTAIKVDLRIDGFLISPTEVTEDEFQSVMGFNPSYYRGNNLPVHNVSWWDAIRYCNARSLREGLQPCYDLATGACDRRRNGYRLPTEAEWITAAGDQFSSDPAKLSRAANMGNNNTKDIAPLLEIVRKGPSAVASREPNRFGIYDMLGNVWEWSQDWFDSVVSYPSAENPDGPSWGIARTLLGGSFASSTSGWSRHYRTSMPPDQRSRYTGFRVCRTGTPASSPPSSETSPEWFKTYNERPAGLHFDRPLASLLADEGTKIVSKEQWAKHTSKLRTKWQKILGTCPANIESPAFRTIREFHEPDYTGTLGALQVEPDFWEDVFIMEPNRPADRPRPVVIVPFYDVDAPAGKDIGGRRYTPPGVRSLALVAVQQGYTAVAIRWFGESYAESYSEAVANLELRNPGCTGLGKWVSDAHQLVNFLEHRPDIDTRRIAIFGHSLGGKMALYAAAFDERISVAISSELGMGFRQSNYDDYWYFGRRLTAAPPGTDQHELLALLAPRPFLLIGGDMYDGNNSWQYIDAARSVYSLLGAENHIGYFNHHQGHSPTPDAVWRSMQWLRHFFSAQ